MITYVEPNHELVASDYLDHWRVFNGRDWVHGFKDKQQAIDFAERNGGTRIAFYKKVHGKPVFINPMRIEVK